MKNTTIQKVLVLLLVPVLYYVVVSGFNHSTTLITHTSTNTVNSAIMLSPGGDKNFINCIFNGGINYWDSDWVETQLNKNMYSDSLHFNTIHLYDVIAGDVNGTPYYGEFLPDLTQDQIAHTNDLLTLTNSKNLKLLYDRCKISKLCYAQRLVYEVSPNNSTENNGFCYQNGGGDYTTDSGRTVRHGADPSQQFPNGYWLSQNIYENLQHSDLYGFNLQYADSGTWYMKPMMRIDSNIVDNYPEKPVVKISVTNFRNDTIKSVVIKARYFRDANGNYGGQYKETFNFGLDTFNLEVSGSDTLDNGLGKGIRGYDYWQWPANCHIDFKVYWLGEVEVWFDKMTVDDKYGDELFRHLHDTKIYDEVSHFANHSGLYSFFADEIVYSQLAACRYVDSVMKYYNANAHLHIACSNYLNTVGFKNNSIGHRVMFQTVHPYSVNPDVHEFYGLLPYEFNGADPRFPDWWKSTDNYDYSRQLQEHCFGDRNSITDEYYYWTHDNRYLPAPQGSLVYQLELVKQLINNYSPSTKMIMQPQIQMFTMWYNSTGKFGGNREPTNEEIQAQAMLSIAHGADGICWFIYNSATWSAPPGSQDSLFQIGLLNRKQDGYTPRHSNFYGQDKWNYVRDMNLKIEKWIPTLNSINWQAGYSVHSDSADHYFIDGIQSTYQVAPPEGPVYSDTVKYWEIGFFNDPNNSNNKYFIMVNRRCVPGSDWRWLGIKFDAAALSTFRNWKIQDVYTGQDTTFDKLNQGTEGFVRMPAAMKTFQPGEGKLFKLTPVM